MPKIRMIKTTPGSLNGFEVMSFIKDQEYVVPDELAKAFIEHLGVATIVRERKAVPEAPEKAVVEAAPENKAVLTEEEEEAGKDESIEEHSVDDAENATPIVEEDKSMAMRVYQLADELNVDYKKIIKVAKKLKIYVSAATSGLSEEEAEKIKAAM